MIQQADKARQLLLSEIEERISKSSIDKAAELIQHTLPEKLKKDVHAQWVVDLLEGGFAQLKNIGIPKDTNDVKVVSAFAMNDAQRKALFNKIKVVLGRELEIKEEVDPKIVAGIIISVGSLVLDGSFRNKTQEQAKSVKYRASE